MARVLVVSQHIRLRSLLIVVLTRSGHDVEAVISRAEAMPIVTERDA